MPEYFTKGCSLFLAAIYDDEGKLIAETANSMVSENCSHCYAEMNAIKAAQQALNTYDLSPYNLSLYVTSEQCIMCWGHYVAGNSGCLLWRSI